MQGLNCSTNVRIRQRDKPSETHLLSFRSIETKRLDQHKMNEVLYNKCSSRPSRSQLVAHQFK